MDAATAARICDEQIYPKNAGLYGLSDRGTIQVGKRANICMIDHERLNVHLPRMIFDLPSGRDRLLQGANGFIATLMNGVVTRRNHVETGTRPGRPIRSRAA